MKHGSLFSGIGGFDLAAEWMGWENVFHCEWNLFGQKVLKYYWPKAISYNDITKTDFTIHRENIDILTGGFPCQPYSLAGKRKGKEDERHLWPEMLRAIREIQPRWVVGENVYGLVNWSGGLVFNEVQTDLEAEGYEVFPYVLPACAVNAPHRRDRVWFVAYSNSCRNNRAKGSKKSVWQYENKEKQWGGGTMQINGLSNEWATANTDSKRHEKRQSATFTDRQKRQYCETNFAGQPGSWDNFPNQPPVCSRNDGFPSELDGITFSKWRNESIKAYGNAIVPQVAFQIFKAIQEYELTNG